ncbi:MAG: neutral/alkaline non-lysosomal ceramidase N-terminal domain-containing protein [Verrucomicrobia bacterium]|nr:neutral/alkaline non-lysosomal ceramidase N-terminal domain-containing protein [Verrucomicrobiota bacterium]
MQVLTFLLIGSWIAVLQAEPAAGWKAGVSKVRITPEESIWMSGYASRDRPSEGTRIDLWAKALALEDKAGKRAVLVTLDLVGIDRETSQAVCAAVQDRLRLNRDRIALCVSHTHTGPVLGRNLETMYFLSPEEWAKVQRYTGGLRTNILSAILQAVERLAPAKLSWASGQETFGVNRRNNPEQFVPAWRATGTLKGPADYAVPVLRVADEKDKLAAIVFGYACHATVLSDYQWSGDYPGYAQLALERNHPEAVALFVAGCGADINPLPRRTPELAMAYGERLAAAVDRALNGIQTPIQSRLTTSHREIVLPFDDLPSREELQKNLQSTNRYIAAHAKKFIRELNEGRAIPKNYPYPIGVWQFGETLTFVTLGGEVVVDYSLRLKREVGPGLWVAGYSHDVMAYIPSLRVWKEGGYEGATAMIYYGLPTRWASGVEELIVEQARRQVQEVRGAP